MSPIDHTITVVLLLIVAILVALAVVSEFGRNK